MAFYVYNNTESNKTWCGQVVAANAYYLIEETKYAVWGGSDVVITDLSSGDLILSTAESSSGHISSAAVALERLRGHTSMDAEGAVFSRTKAAPAGWHFQLRCVEITTSSVSGCFTENVDGSTSGNFITATFKDIAGNTLTTQESVDTDCVLTIVDFEPSWDYEMIGGQLFQSAAPSSRVVLHVVAVPDVPAAYGGSVEFGKSINLQHIGQAGGINMDGRASKRLTYSATYHTNKLRMTFRHTAGMQHSCLLVFELFKPS
jgi:hypothetical protein